MKPIVPKKREPVRIGYYICHCGTNIAGMVDVEAVAKYVGTLPNVAVKKLTSAKTANDPNSRINKSLRAWNC